MGYGKETEQIIKLLGSRQHEEGDEEDEDDDIVVTKGAAQKQTLLLSATLNEKVNRLAKLSLDDPVMIGLDNSKLLQQKLPPIESPASPDSDEDDEMVIHVNKSANPSSEDYGIPSQLVQKYVKGTLIFTFKSWFYVCPLCNRCLLICSPMWCTSCGTSLCSQEPL